MKTQRDLDLIWSDIKQGSYGNDPNAIKPTIIIDDESEQVISVPNEDGTSNTVYRRYKPNRTWQEVPNVGDEKPFELN